MIVLKLIPLLLTSLDLADCANYTADPHASTICPLDLSNVSTVSLPFNIIRDLDTSVAYSEDLSLLAGCEGDVVELVCPMGQGYWDLSNFINTRNMTIECFSQEWKMNSGETVERLDGCSHTDCCFHKLLGPVEENILIEVSSNVSNIGNDSNRFYHGCINDSITIRCTEAYHAVIVSSYKEVDSEETDIEPIFIRDGFLTMTCQKKSKPTSINFTFFEPSVFTEGIHPGHEFQYVCEIPPEPTVNEFCILKFDEPNENGIIVTEPNTTAKPFLGQHFFYGSPSDVLELECNDTSHTFHLSFLHANETFYENVNLKTNRISFTCIQDKINEVYLYYFKGNLPIIENIKPNNHYSQKCLLPRPTIQDSCIVLLPPPSSTSTFYIDKSSTALIYPYDESVHYGKIGDTLTLNCNESFTHVVSLNYITMQDTEVYIIMNTNKVTFTCKEGTASMEYLYIFVDDSSGIDNIKPNTEISVTCEEPPTEPIKTTQVPTTTPGTTLGSITSTQETTNEETSTIRETNATTISTTETTNTPTVSTSLGTTTPSTITVSLASTSPSTTNTNELTTNTNELTTATTSTTNGTGSSTTDSGLNTDSSRITTISSGVTKSTEPPPPPPKLSEPPESLGPGDLHYVYTANYTESDFKIDYDSIDGSEKEIKSVTAPFGFGSATALRKDQCMSKKNFVGSSQMCLYNPSHCPEGLSFSIWERPYIHGNTFELNELDELDELGSENYQYVLSTGGDNIGHPGFAVYHDLHYLWAVVCTGPQFWEVKTVAMVRDGDWNNIGVIWEETVGLKVYINMTMVGWTAIPEDTTPQSVLVPQEMIIGCHKDHSDTEYRGFVNADLDELAVWAVALEDEELPYLYGGFKDNISLITPDLLSSYADRIDSSDPDQASAALDIAGQISENTETEANPTMETPDGLSSTATSPTSGNKVTTPKTDPDVVKDFSTNAEFTYNLIDPDKQTLDPVPQSKIEELITKSASLINNMFDESNANKWLTIQEDRNTTPGVMQMVDRSTQYNSKLLLKIRWTNESEESCEQIKKSNLLTEVCKMTLADMRKKGQLFKKPVYPEEYDEKWDKPYDLAAIPPGAYEDERCDGRGVGYTLTVYDSISSFIELAFAPKSGISTANPQACDSRVVSFQATVDPVFRKEDGVEVPDTSKHLCILDTQYLSKYPVQIKLEHLVPIFALRKTLFHEDEEVTNVRVRRCVWWNRKAGNGGAWDTEGCSIIQTTPEYTRCGCNKQGTFTIIAEKIEEISVPDDADWLPMGKYVLYGISAGALLLYIVIVTISGDLKDQFHLGGLNMAVAILIGSVAIVLTDMDDVRNDRHTCAAVGTIIHMFYGAMGLWMVGLGHACFRAITQGVVSGRLRAYMAICWGLALAFTGIPYIFFLRGYGVGTDPRCFIGWMMILKLIFFVPQTCCCLAAFFLATVLITNLSTMALRNPTLVRDYGSFSRGFAILLYFTGITWILGIFAYVDFDLEETEMVYSVFHICNSLVGLMLFLCIGVGSSRFRSFVTGKAKERQQQLKTMTNKTLEKTKKTQPKSKPKTKKKK